jgi:hypothetical protein
MTQAPTSKQAFSNPTTQSERAAILKEADRAINTLRAQTNITDPVAGGRWSRIKGEYTVGSEQVPNYPGASAPWSGPQVPDEPPLGYSVEDMEVVGSTEEVERAAAILAATEAPPSVGMTSPIPDSSAAADFVGSAVNSAGQSPATSAPTPQPQDVAAATARRSFSKPSFRRIG